MNSERIIPLHRIGDEFNIILQSPPPYRNSLGIRPKVLTDTLSTLRLEETLLKLDFYRDEPKASVAVSGSGSVNEATRGVVAEEEKTMKRKKIHVDFQTESVLLSLPYKDKNVTTPDNTASHTSEMLRHALAHTPATKYFQEFSELDVDISNVPMYEMADLVGSFIYPTITYLGAMGLVAENKYGYGFFAFGLMYSLSKSLTALDLYRYTNGLKTFFTKDNWISYYEEDPRRILYPPKFTQEVLVPAILWYFHPKLHKENIITSHF